MMIDENNGCITKSKLTITVNIMQWPEQGSSQTNKWTYSDTQKLTHI